MLESKRPYKILYDIFEQQAHTNPNKPALTAVKDLNDPSQSVTYSYQSLFGMINRTARLIAHYADSSKPKCAFLLPVTPEAEFILWGGASIGIAAPLNPLLQADAIGSLIEHSEAEVVFLPGPGAATDTWEKVQSVKQRLPNLKAVISVGNRAEGATAHFEDAVMDFSDDPLEDHLRPEESDACAYFHTGGTTGTPKLAIHTHKAHVATAYLWESAFPEFNGGVSMNGLPMFHVGGSILNSMCHFAVNGHVVLPHPAGFRDPATIQNFWKIVEDYKVQGLLAIPTSLGSIAQVPLGDANIESLQFFMTGGMIVPEAISKAVTRVCGRPVHEFYGMTESCGFLAAPDLAAPPITGSPGKAIGNSEFRIGDSGSPAGEIGEVQFRGPNVFAGYLGGVDSPFTDDGWLKSGDLGYLDAEGHLFITGRAKDLIIRSGHNIDPIIIEACLEKHPAVSMAAAIGKPDAYAGELPTVYVELIKGETATEQELLAFAVENIDERPACPREVTIVDELPKTAVGKIFKPALRTESVAKVLNQAFADKGLADSINCQVSLNKEGVVKTVVQVLNETDRGKVVEQAKVLSETYRLDVMVDAWCR